MQMSLLMMKLTIKVYNSSTMDKLSFMRKQRACHRINIQSKLKMKIAATKNK